MAQDLVDDYPAPVVDPRVAVTVMDVKRILGIALSAAQVALLPAVEWLEIIVTTRLDPARFGAGERWQQAVEIPPLPDADALDLVRDFQPGHRFASESEEAAAREYVYRWNLAIDAMRNHTGMADHYAPHLLGL